MTFFKGNGNPLRLISQKSSRTLCKRFFSLPASHISSSSCSSISSHRSADNVRVRNIHTSHQYRTLRTLACIRTSSRSSRGNESTLSVFPAPLVSPYGNRFISSTCAAVKQSGSETGSLTKEADRVEEEEEGKDLRKQNRERDQNEDSALDTFDENIKTDIIKMMSKSSNINDLTEYQHDCYGKILKGRDVMLHAETGAGKTIAYLAPLIHQMILKDAGVERSHGREDNTGSSEGEITVEERNDHGRKKKSNNVFAVILAPTNELVRQLKVTVDDLFGKTLRMDVASSSDEDRQNLKVMPNTRLVISTPKALLDYNLKQFLSHVEVVVFDEVDELFTGSFVETSHIMDFLTPTREFDSFRKEAFGAGSKQARRVYRQMYAGRKKRPLLYRENNQSGVQKIFAGATLPTRGKFSVWDKIQIPCNGELELLQSKLVHCVKPSLEMNNMIVERFDETVEELLSTNVSAAIAEQDFNVSIAKMVPYVREECNRVVDLEYKERFNLEDDVAKSNYLFSLLESFEKERTHSADNQVIVFFDSSKRLQEIGSYFESRLFADRLFTGVVEGEDMGKMPFKKQCEKSVEKARFLKAMPNAFRESTVCGKIELLHSRFSRRQRLAKVEEFANGNYSVLFTTDMSARGMDFTNVSCVVQFDFASNVSTFLHRIGRTARFERQGCVVNMLTDADLRLAEDLVASNSEAKVATVTGKGSEEVREGELSVQGDSDTNNNNSSSSRPIAVREFMTKNLAGSKKTQDRLARKKLRESANVYEDMELVDESAFEDIEAAQK